MAQSELDQLRKIVRMMNSGTLSLDHILCMVTTSKARKGIGYQKGYSDSKSTTQKEISRLKTVSIEEPVRKLSRTGTSGLNTKKQEGR